MNKNVFGLGLVLILAGLIVASASNMIVPETNPTLMVQTEREWAVSHAFSEGENIFLDFKAGEQWVYVFEGGGDKLPINITIAGPNGNQTVFEVLFAQWPYPSSQDPTAPPDIYADTVKLLSLAGDTLTVATPVYRVGGVARQNGVYTATVSVQWTTDPPSYLAFYKDVKEQSYPYAGFLPVGMTVDAFGIAVSVFGIKAKKKLRQRKS